MQTIETKSNNPSGQPAPKSSAEPLSFEQFWHENYAARHAEERMREAQLQDEAFIDCTHTVCGLELRGMSAYDLLLLHSCDNPFVVGGTIAPAHIAQFAAVLAQPAPSGWFGRRRFFAQVARYPYAHAVAELQSFVVRMFASSGINITKPKQSESAGIVSSAEPLNMCFLAPLVVKIAGDTGWAEADILAMRLDKLFQYGKALERRAGGKESLAPSDRLLSQALADYSRYLAELQPAAAS